MKIPNTWCFAPFSVISDVTDYVANGSFASLKQNVTYKREKDYAILVRFTDFVKKWEKDFVYVDKASYEFLFKSFLNPGDIIISNVGDPGKVFRVPNLGQPMTLGPNAVVLRPNEYIDKGFLTYFFASAWGQELIRKIVTGTAQKKFNKTSLRTLEIPITSFNEQRRIVSKIEELFSDLDAGEAALRKAQRLIEMYRQSVLKAAVTGELTRDWREKNKNEKVSIEQLYETHRKIFSLNKKYTPPQKANSEGLDQIPTGWCWSTVELISLNVQYGYTASSDTKEVGPKFLRITDIQDNRVDWDTVPYCEISPEKALSYEIKDGDILFARTGATVGKSFLIKGDVPNAVFASYLIKIVPNKTSVEPRYLAYFFQSWLYWRQIYEGQVGIGQPNFNGSKLSQLIVSLCSHAEQIEISNILDGYFSQIDSLQAEIENKRKRNAILRQSILKQAFEGKLVPQDPADEPASELLKRISTQSSQPKAARGRKKKAAA